jgi:hypothetical protein
MERETLHLSQRIARPADEVYEYAADPANIPEWAPGLGSAVENVAGSWFVEAPMGRVRVAFAERNAFGVLDHEVTLPSGEVVHNPMRIIPDADECDAVFTLRRQPGMSDDEFARDAAAVAADLVRLKEIVEAHGAA